MKIYPMGEEAEVKFKPRINWRDVESTRKPIEIKTFGYLDL